MFVFIFGFLVGGFNLIWAWFISSAHWCNWCYKSHSKSQTKSTFFGTHPSKQAAFFAGGPPVGVPIRPDCRVWGLRGNCNEINVWSNDQSRSNLPKHPYDFFKWKYYCSKITPKVSNCFVLFDLNYICLYYSPHIPMPEQRNLLTW